MTARVVIFILFVLLTGSIIYSGKNKNLFNENRGLSNKDFVKLQDTKAKQAAEAIAMASGNVQVVAKSEGPDLTNPLVKKGYDVYTGNGQCIKCHGDNGQGDEAQLAPLIAGQHDWYVEEQLGYMKSGKRVNDKMMPYLKDLNEGDFKALAAYIKDLRVK